MPPDFAKPAAGVDRCRKPATILYVEGNQDGTIGGSFYSLLYLAGGLDRSRFQPIVVFHSYNSLIPRFNAAGVATRVIPHGRPVTGGTPFGRRYAKVANFAKGFVLEPLDLARMLRRENVDLVHLNNSIISNHVWMLAARFAGIPCVTHERGINETFSRRAKWLAQGLDAIICISHAVSDNFARLGLSKLPLVTIPNGLDPRQMTASKSRADILAGLEVDPRRPVIGIVGNIKRWKGQDVVIRALARLGPQHGDVACLIIGDKSAANLAYSQELVTLIDDLGLKDRVVITGYRSNVADYIAALDVLVHASVLPEPFGRVLLEGMAMQKPVVASRGGAVPEIVVDGVTGLLFDAGDDARLADALASLLSDRGRMAAMGRAGHARLVADFGIERNVAATESVYERALSSHR